MKCLECAESYVKVQSTSRTRSSPAVVAVRKALKNEREKLKEKIRQQQKKQRQIKLLYAIEKKDSATVLKCLDHTDGAQADGTDENGHPFVVHANSAYRYDADPPRVLAKDQDVDLRGNENDVYRILTTRCEKLVKPRIIDVGGNRFFVHDPSPTLILDDLGVLPALIDGDKNYGRSDSEKSYDPNVFIDRDPRVFSTILDFYHMGEHMKWTQKVTDSEELLKALYREARYYLLPKLMTNTLEKIKYYPTYVLLQKGESLVPFLQTICSGREYVYENVALVLEVYSTNANHRQQNLYGTDECSLSNFTDDGVMMGFHMGNGVKEVTEGISTAILEEKEWLLTLHLMFPESQPVIQKMDDEGNTYFDAKCKCGQCSDCDWHFEYRQTKIYLRTCLKEVTRAG